MTAAAVTRTTSPMLRAVAVSAAVARNTALAAHSNRARSEYLMEAAPRLIAELTALLGDADLPAPSLLSEEDWRALWPLPDNCDGAVAIDLGDVVFTLDPDHNTGIYAAVRCDDGHIRVKRWIRELADLGDLFIDARPCPRCFPETQTAKKQSWAQLKQVLSQPRAAVDGGSDSDNLAVIAHNLGYIGVSLDGFFDCGASFAGRGS